MNRTRCRAVAAAAAAMSLTFAARAAPEGSLQATSPLGRKLYALPDDDAVAAARAKLKADPKNPALVLALSLAHASRRQYREAVAACTAGLADNPKSADLYIERGHRELGLSEFASAQRDLEKGAELAPRQGGAFYHLGLAHYFQGHFDRAAEALRDALARAQDDDSVIDATHWLYVSLRRAGREKEAAGALQRITPAVKNTEPHLLFYLKLLRFYQGSLAEKDVLPPRPADPADTEAELAFATQTYAVGNFRLYTRAPRDPASLFREVVQGNVWNAWGFIGAETELARRPH